MGPCRRPRPQKQQAEREKAQTSHLQVLVLLLKCNVEVLNQFATTYSQILVILAVAIKRNAYPLLQNLEC